MKTKPASFSTTGTAPEPPAGLVQAQGEALAALNAVRAKYAGRTLHNQREVEERNAEIAAAESTHCKAVIALAEWHSQALQPALATAKAAIPALVDAVSAADRAHRAGRQRVAVITNAIDAHRSVATDAHRHLQRLSPLPVDPEKRRLTVGAALAL